MRSSKPLRGPGSSMSTGHAAGHKPGIGPSTRLPTKLVTRFPSRPLSLVTALRGTAASRTGRA
jgi:hypothetical protein